jgi:succinate dehydrogenase/fumarate reductase iron-sulfur protein
MTTYLQPIIKPEAVHTIRIRCFNRETDAKPHWQVYSVPYVRSMTVIQALEHLWDQNTYIAFRANCREMTCGSCAMLINGKPQLACMTLLENESKVEPLSQYPVLRDLIVDTSSVEQKYRDLKLWPERQRGAQVGSVSSDVLEAYQQTYSRCIECHCCLESCPQSDAETTQFDGPMFMLQMARIGSHPLDTENRSLQAIKRGAFSCVNCYECAAVCPVDLNAAEEIGRLRGSALRRTFSVFFRRLLGRHSAAQ